MDPENLAEMEQFLRDWAADNKAVFDWEGECGFGRECVGISKNGAWVDLYGYDAEYRPMDGALDPALVCAPPETPDAYHKHDCLAVLGRGPAAITQLYHWVRKLEANNVVVKVVDRPVSPNAHPIELIMHGVTQPVLRLKESA